MTDWHDAYEELRARLEAAGPRKRSHHRHEMIEGDWVTEQAWHPPYRWEVVEPEPRCLAIDIATGRVVLRIEE